MKPNKKGIEMKKTQYLSAVIVTVFLVLGGQCSGSDDREKIDAESGFGYAPGKTLDDVGHFTTLDAPSLGLDTSGVVSDAEVVISVSCVSGTLPCGQECCTNEYQCAEAEQDTSTVKGCILPGTTFCGFYDSKKWVCSPSEECMDEKICQEMELKAEECCKPFGGDDCEEAENGYCDPGEVCTHKNPACCPDAAQIACGGACCLNGETCSNDGKKCLAPGEEYCGNDLVCPVGKTCAKSTQGCMPDNAKDCGDGNYCEVGYVCAENGCCPDDMEVCGNGCCDPGDDCEYDMGQYYCVPPGGEYCGGGIVCGPGTTCCGDFCMPNGADCCGDYYCDAGEVCVGNNSCCYATAPMLCVDACCQKSDYCENYQGKGICVAPGWQYCGNGVQCAPGKTCCSSGSTSVCMPDGSDCCLAKGLGDTYCEAGKVCVDGNKCCPATSPNHCGNKCCLSTDACYEASDGTFLACVPAGGDYCAISSYCNPGYSCCGDSPPMSSVCASAGGKCCSPKCDCLVCEVKILFICLVCKVDGPNCTNAHSCEPGKECCGDSCMPVGADCCTDNGSFCSPGKVCVGSGNCCPAAYPKLCPNDPGKCCQ